MLWLFFPHLHSTTPPDVGLSPRLGVGDAAGSTMAEMTSRNVTGNNRKGRQTRGRKGWQWQACLSPSLLPTDQQPLHSSLSLSTHTRKTSLPKGCGLIVSCQSSKGVSQASHKLSLSVWPARPNAGLAKARGGQVGACAAQSFLPPHEMKKIF